MPIEIAKIKLSYVHRITTLEQTALVYHRVPGAEGNIAQDLGRDSVRLQIEGIFYGPKAAEDLESLRKIYKKREAVDFLADVVGQAYFGKVTLDRFEVGEVSGEPGQFKYTLTVVEYVQPPQSGAKAPATKATASKINASQKVQAKSFMKVASLSNALKGGNLPAISNPAESLKGATTQITETSKDVDGVTSGLNTMLKMRVATPPPAATEQTAKKPPIDKPLEWSKSSKPSSNIPSKPKAGP
jgi:hypothetical protein